MKKLVLAIMAAAIFGFCVPASAQMDHFETVGSCMAAPKNTLHYFPTFVHQQRLMENEVIGGLPQLSCVEMQLPDRLVGKEGRGWVRIGDDRKVIFDKNTGKPLRLAECNNTIFEVVPLPEAIPEKGDPGQDGAGCTVKENGDGTKTILCGDRTSAIVRITPPSSRLALRFFLTSCCVFKSCPRPSRA